MKEAIRRWDMPGRDESERAIVEQQSESIGRITWPSDARRWGSRDGIDTWPAISILVPHRLSGRVAPGNYHWWLLLVVSRTKRFLCGKLGLCEERTNCVTAQQSERFEGHWTRVTVWLPTRQIIWFDYAGCFWIFSKHQQREWET